MLPWVSCHDTVKIRENPSAALGRRNGKSITLKHIQCPLFLTRPVLKRN
jgi:hypothetical protein